MLEQEDFVEKVGFGTLLNIDKYNNANGSVKKLLQRGREIERKRKKGYVYPIPTNKNLFLNIIKPTGTLD